MTPARRRTHAPEPTRARLRAAAPASRAGLRGQAGGADARNRLRRRRSGRAEGSCGGTPVLCGTGFDPVGQAGQAVELQVRGDVVVLPGAAITVDPAAA